MPIMTDSNTYSGLLVGFNRGDVRNSYSAPYNKYQATNVALGANSYRPVYYDADLTYEQLCNPSTYDARYWDFTNTWNQATGSTPPTLKIFNKIVAIIEQRIVKGYTKIIDSFNIRKGNKLKKIISFTKRIDSEKVANKKKNNKVVSLMSNIKSKTSKLTKGFKTRKSFSNTITSTTSKSIKKLEMVKSFVRSSFSKAISSIGMSIIIRSFVDKINTKNSKTMKKVERVTAHSKKYMSGIFAELKLVYRVVVSSFINTINSKSNVNRKSVKTVENYSRKVTSNLSKSLVKTLKTYTNAITLKVVGLKNILRQVKSYSKNIRARAIRTAKGSGARLRVLTSHFGVIKSKTNLSVNHRVKAYIDSINGNVKTLKQLVKQNIRAIVSHKLSPIRLFVKSNQSNMDYTKNKTHVKYRDGGD